MNKPRLKYAEVFLDFDAMEHETTKLLLDGEPCIYAGHHFDRIVWLRIKRQVLAFRPEDLRWHLQFDR